MFYLRFPAPALRFPSSGYYERLREQQRFMADFILDLETGRVIKDRVGRPGRVLGKRALQRFEEQVAASTLAA